MKLRILLFTLIVLLSACASTPKPLNNAIRTYDLAYNTTVPVGTLYLHRNTGNENCIIIVTIDNSTVGNMLQIKSVGFKLNYGEYLVGVAFRGDFCGKKDSLATVVIDSEQPYNLEVEMDGEELRLFTRPADQQ